jgi:hypothetical protein
MPDKPIEGTSLTQLTAAPSPLGPSEPLQTGKLPAEISELWAGLAEMIGRVGQWFTENEAAIRTFIESLATWVTTVPDSVRQVLTVLADDGWFADGDMTIPFPYTYVDLVTEGRMDEATALMRVHFSQRMHGIQAELSAAHPQRSAMFDAAFQAVDRGEHSLAIPLLFAQVDGICWDKIRGQSFFRADQRRAIAESLADTTGGLASRLVDAYLAPFKQEIPILLNEKQRDAGFTKLNRHQVMHGESLDYGTFDNSLRAISLLNYISQRLQHRDLMPMTENAT